MAMNYELYEGRVVSLNYPDYHHENVKAMITKIDDFGMHFEILAKFQGDTRAGEQLFISKNSSFSFVFEDTVRKSFYHNNEEKTKIVEISYETEEMYDIVKDIFNANHDILGIEIIYDDYAMDMNSPEVLDKFSDYFKETVLSISENFRDNYIVKFIKNLED